jgi:ribosomal protein S18 acetylase RimI-like enzyme
MISCGFSTLSFNIVCDTHLKDKSYEDMVERVDKFYGKTPYVWWLGGPTMPSGFNLYLKSRGFILFSEENAMVCDLTKSRDLPAPPDLRIEQVTTMQHLEDFAKVLSAFESKIDTIYMNELLISEKFRETNPLFVGYIDNRPVSTGSLCIQNKTASLHDLATDAKFRNKGIGTGMIRHRIRYAIEKGINTLCLTTNLNSAFSLYQKMGFEVVDKFECYLSHENYR